MWHSRESAGIMTNLLLVKLICATIHRRLQRKGTPMAARTDFNSVPFSKPNIFRQPLFLCLFVLLIGLPTYAESGAQAGAWKAGAATTRITPDHPMWMAGYAARNKPSEGKVHDLHAKGLALEDSRGQRLVIVTLDLVGIDRLMRDWLRDQVALRFGYVPSLRVLREGGYEGGDAMRYTPLPGPFAPSVEERIVTTVHRLVDRVRLAPNAK